MVEKDHGVAAETTMRQRSTPSSLAKNDAIHRGPSYHAKPRTPDNPCRERRATSGTSRRPLMIFVAIIVAASVLSPTTRRSAASVWPISKIIAALSSSVDHSVFEITPGIHPSRRSDRFPSVSERVRFYMTDDWYDPNWARDGQYRRSIPAARFVLGSAAPTPADTKSSGVSAGGLVLIPPKDTEGDSSGMGAKSVALDAAVEADVPFLVDRTVVLDCARPPVRFRRDGQKEVLPTGSDGKFDSRFVFYCEDILEALEVQRGVFSAIGRNTAGASTAHPPPLLFQIGDNALRYDLLRPLRSPVPVMHKWRMHRASPRSAVRGKGDTRGDDTQSDPATFRPILWPLSYVRHFETPMAEVRQNDIPWKDKLDTAVWRGALTGLGLTLELIRNMDETSCRAAPRCLLCLKHAGSELVDAGLVANNLVQGNFTIGGTLLCKNRMSITQLLRYKMILSIEGNDVATNLKWALLSRSVVLMTNPSKESWAMEALLEPWVHFIPLATDYSNLEDRVQWVRENGAAAKKIAERATLFISDMLYHPDALKDDRRVMEEILLRYDHLLVGSNEAD